MANAVVRDYPAEIICARKTHRWGATPSREAKKIPRVLIVLLHPIAIGTTRQ
jgi:hypothetical protein